MPITFNLNREVAVITTIRDVDFGLGIEVLKHGLTELATHPVNPVILFDVQQTEEDRSTGEIRKIVDRIQEQTSGAHVAILVASDLLYGMGRMFGSYAEGAGLNAMVFREGKCAWKWCLEWQVCLHGNQVVVSRTTQQRDDSPKPQEQNLGDAC